MDLNNPPIRDCVTFTYVPGTEAGDLGEEDESLQQAIALSLAESTEGLYDYKNKKQDIHTSTKSTVVYEKRNPQIYNDKMVIFIDGDGNCLINAFTLGLEQVSDYVEVPQEMKTSSMLRNACADYLEKYLQSDEFLRGLVYAAIGEYNDDEKSLMIYKLHLADKEFDESKIKEEEYTKKCDEYKSDYKNNIIEVTEQEINSIDGETKENFELIIQELLFKKYIERIRADRFWCSTPQIYTLCKIFNASCEVFSFNDAQDDILLDENRGYKNPGAHQRAIVRLHYEGNRHFNTVVNPRDYLAPPQIRSSQLDANMLAKNLQEIYEKQNIAEKITNLEGQQILDLHGDECLTNEQLKQLTLQNPNLTELNLDDCTQITSFEGCSFEKLEKICLYGLVNLENDKLVHLTHIAPNLKEINLAACIDISSFHGCRFDKLEKIILYDVDLLSNDEIAQLTRLAPNLKELHLPNTNAMANFTDWKLDALEIIGLSSINGLSNQSLVQLSKKSPNLREIDLTDCTAITNFDGCFFNKLKKIDLNGLEQLTNQSIESLCRAAPNLNVLLIGNCPNISDLRNCLFAALEEIDLSYSLLVDSARMDEQVLLSLFEIAPNLKIITGLEQL